MEFLLLFLFYAAQKVALGFPELAGNGSLAMHFWIIKGEKKGGILVHDEILIELEALKERRGDCSAARTMETITLANNSIVPSF